MDRLFWTFCTFLVILTMISAFGGSIRFRENFLEELFESDGDASLNENAASISNDILSQTLVSQEEGEENIVPAPIASPTPTPTPTPAIKKPTTTTPPPPPPPATVKPSRTNFLNSNDNSYGPVIEAFDGGLYASFK